MQPFCHSSKVPYYISYWLVSCHLGPRITFPSNYKSTFISLPAQCRRPGGYKPIFPISIAEDVHFEQTAAIFRNNAFITEDNIVVKTQQSRTDLDVILVAHRLRLMKLLADISYCKLNPCNQKASGSADVSS